MTNQQNPINSKSLQKRFPDIYEELFSKNPMVVSAPAIFYWSGDYNILFGGPAIMQKMPRRIYFGLQTSPQGGIHVESFKIYDQEQEQFRETNSMETLLTNKANDALKVRLAKLIPESQKNGVIVNILSEIPAFHSMNRSDAFAAALSLALFVHYKKITPEEINNWQKTNTQDLLLNKKLKFQLIHRLAWKINTNYQGDCSSGAGVFASLVPSDIFPMVYFTEKRMGDILDHPPGCKPLGIKRELDMIDNIKCWGFALDELLGLEHVSQFPFDFGTIFPGTLRTIENLMGNIEYLKHVTSNSTLYINNTITPKIPMQDHVNPPITALGTKDAKWQISDSYLNIGSLLSTAVLAAFGKILKEGSLEENMREFTRALNHYNAFLSLLQYFSSNVKTEHLNYRLRRLMNKKSYSIFATKMQSIDQSGDVLFVMPFDEARGIILQTLEEIKNHNGNNIKIDYLSWRDGYETEGAKIEQNLDEKQYSSFISEGAIEVSHFNPNGNLHKNLYSLENFKKIKKETDLLIDKGNEVICIRGECLTSKNIHSATMTIELLTTLIKNYPKKISNVKLRRSSYSLNRNELQSKIITPLAKIIKKRLGKELPIYITGSLNTFYIELEPSLDIRLIEKIF